MRLIFFQCITERLTAAHGLLIALCRQLSHGIFSLATWSLCGTRVAPFCGDPFPGQVSLLVYIFLGCPDVGLLLYIDLMVDRLRTQLCCAPGGLLRIVLPL